MNEATIARRGPVQRGNRLFEALYSRFVLAVPRVHAALLRFLLSDREDVIELFGSTLIINRRKEAGYWRAARLARSSSVLWKESGSLLSLALLLQPGDTFVDVGANVGLFSASLARLRRIVPSVRFYAFEANSDTAVRLKENARDGVEAFATAISDRDTLLTFVMGTTSLTFGVAQSEGTLQLDGHTVQVSTRRLDEMNIAGDSLVLKIDVENHERQVLDGAAGLFAADRVKAVLIDGYTDPAIPRLLAERGFALFDGRTLGRGVTSNLLAIRTDRLERSSNATAR